MRKSLYLLFTLLTFYLAGRYRMGELFLLFCVEVLLFAAMFAIAVYARRSLSIEIHVEQSEIRKGEIAEGWIEATNRGRLPVPKFRVQLFYSHNKTRAEDGEWLGGYVPAGGAARVTFKVESRFCGIVDVWLGKVEIEDYLSLFRLKKKFDREAEILVIPSGAGLRIDVREYGIYSAAPELKQIVPMGDQPPDISQIEPYRPGDAMKDIHWKLSARNDQLLSKRYVEEESIEALVYLNLFAWEKMSVARMDAFLEVSSAVSIGLLEGRHTHRVQWYDAAGGVSVVHGIETYSAYRRMIEELIRLLTRDAVWAEGSTQAEGSMQAEESVYIEALYGEQRDGEVALTINTDLELLLWNGREFHFSEEGHIMEIMEGEIAV
jgi:uncharacterized protein (DUF58 family)